MEGNKYTRKLTVTGQGKTYYVTLPRELVKLLKWRKGERKIVSAKDGKVIIEDWKSVSH